MLKPVPLVETDAPRPRRGPGRGSELSHLEREEANRLWVQGATKTEIARRLNCSTTAVRHALDCPQGTSYREDAKAELRRHRGKYLKDWERASSVASEKGDHRPARDALQAAGLIDHAPTPSMTISFTGFVLPGLPVPPGASGSPTTITVTSPPRALPPGDDAA